MRRLNTDAIGFDTAFATLLADQRELAEDVTAATAAIIADVRARGDAALRDYTLTFDGVDLEEQPLLISPAEVRAARGKVPADVLNALAFARERIVSYHERQRPHDEMYTDAAGVRLGWRWRALDSVGLYVPGGRAAYPSSLLMNAVPAKVAGVARVVMVVPARDGEVAAVVLAAADLAGVDEIYRVGGAQAVAALAYGTETVRPVDKIVGPGNAYVASAKRQVFGAVGIDMVAGPSEVVVVADGGAHAEHVAADLLAQAEHDEAAQSVLITTEPTLADAVAGAVERQLGELPREKTARASWDNHGAIIVTASLEEATMLVDRLAPEHLQLAIDNPDALAAKVRHAGAIFLGYDTPEVVGDYVAGPNHVLPTSRSARFSSGLSVMDFIKRTTLLGVDRVGLAALAPSAMTLAAAEGLDAHRLSVARRIDE